MKRPITKQDIEQAVTLAEEAFWAVIASQFPEAKTGDLDLSLSVATTMQNHKAVTGWVEANIGTVRHA